LFFNIIKLATGESFILSKKLGYKKYFFVVMWCFYAIFFFCEFLSVWTVEKNVSIIFQKAVVIINAKPTEWYFSFVIQICIVCIVWFFWQNCFIHIILLMSWYCPRLNHPCFDFQMSSVDSSCSLMKSQNSVILFWQLYKICPKAFLSYTSLYKIIRIILYVITNPFDSCSRKLVYF